jgi:hypothetical protein
MDRVNEECMIFNTEEIAAFVEHPDTYPRRNELIKHLPDCPLCRENVANVQKSKLDVPDPYVTPHGHSREP